MIFLKKTSVIAINLKPARFFLLSGIFFSVLYISIFLSSALPPIVAEKDFIRLVLSCNASYTNVPLSSVGVFSLVKKDITNPENTMFSSEETDVSAVKVSVPQKSEENPLIKLSNATDLKINPEDYLASPLSFLKEDISVTEISNKCGFSSISYFSRIFKKETGVTPLKYRKINKKAFFGKFPP